MLVLIFILVFKKVFDVVDEIGAITLLHVAKVRAGDAKCVRNFGCRQTCRDTYFLHVFAERTHRGALSPDRNHGVVFPHEAVGFDYFEQLKCLFQLFVHGVVGLVREVLA